MIFMQRNTIVDCYCSVFDIFRKVCFLALPFFAMINIAGFLLLSVLTWHGYRPRPQPMRLCVKRGPSPPPKFSAHVYYSHCDFVRTLHISAEKGR